MTESLLPLSFVRKFRLTLGDLAILQVASRELGVTQAEVLRIAVRRFAFLDAGNGLSSEAIRDLTQECGGLAIGVPTCPSVEHVRPKLLDEMAEQATEYLNGLDTQLAGNGLTE